MSRMIDEAMDDLKKRCLILEMDNRLIMLGVPGVNPGLPRFKDFPGGYIEME